MLYLIFYVIERYGTHERPLHRSLILSQHHLTIFTAFCLSPTPDLPPNT
jgi:hypothetical protein